MINKDQMWEVLTVVTADRDKYKYALSQYQDQSARIAWLENRVVELERQLSTLGYA